MLSVAFKSTWESRDNALAQRVSLLVRTRESSSSRRHSSSWAVGCLGQLEHHMYLASLEQSIWPHTYRWLCVLVLYLYDIRSSVESHCFISVFWYISTLKGIIFFLSMCVQIQLSRWRNRGLCRNSIFSGFTNPLRYRYTIIKWAIDMYMCTIITIQYRQHNWYFGQLESDVDCVKLN